METTVTATPRRRLLIALALVAACTAAALATGSPPAADAVNAKVLGKTRSVPNPACPTRGSLECEAVGSVTGFQRIAQGKENLFRAREDGRVVAWSMSLANPTADEEKFFGNFFQNESFGRRPSARIAVISRKGTSRYELKRQSPAVSLDGLQDGRTHYFTLNDSLRIRRRDVLAITLPTWAAMFRPGLTRSKNEWRASRLAGKCNGNANIKDGRPHQNEGSTRSYECDYDGARLLYWGFYRPD
jgi:hypothetical protein